MLIHTTTKQIKVEGNVIIMLLASYVCKYKLQFSLFDLMYVCGVKVMKGRTFSEVVCG